MTSTRPFAAAVAAASLSAATSAGAVVRFTDYSLWSSFAATSGASVLTEDFNSIADGFYTSPFSRTVGGITWSAAATGGLFVQGGQFSTNNPEMITFSMSPGVQGVAGNFYGTDINFNLVPAIVQVTLNDGSAYIGFATSASDFVGFYSTGAAISSISVSAQAIPGSSANVYPTADNLYFAVVPAPGAVSLLAVAGLVGTRRRR